MPEPVMLTQIEVNMMMAAQRRDYEAKRAALEVEIGKNKASEDELVDTLAAHGVTVGDGEPLTDAGNRFLAQLEADDQRRTSEHEAALAQLRSESDASFATAQAELASVNGRLTAITIDDTIRKAAREARAYDPDQVVAFYRDKARLLDNGEVVLKNAVPDFLHSPAELVDHLKNCPESANLFAPSGR